MPKIPFSHLTPSPKPGASAVGESGYHLPLMPFLSGQDAVDSLIGYYPSRARMDSAINPHTYQRPTTLRGTTMPHTKVAELVKMAQLRKRERRLREIDPGKSQFVAGFLVKCGEAGFDYNELADACAIAMASHPAIADEFEKCGFIKQAFGSGAGYSMDYNNHTNHYSAPAKPKPKYRPEPARANVEGVKVQRLAPSSPSTPGTPPAAPKQPWYQLPTPTQEPGAQMDHLARQGVRIPSGYSPVSSGMPSRAAMLTGQYPPTQYMNQQGQNGMVLPSTEDSPGGWLDPSQTSQYNATMAKRRAWEQLKAQAGEDHPYFSQYSAPGQRAEGTTPERLGYNAFRTDPTGFMEDYQGWTGTMKPEALEQFHNIAKEVGLEPEALARALTAEQFIRSKVPFAHRELRQQAEEAFGEGKLTEQPNHPGYAERMRAFNQLPDDFQDALGRWQNYQVRNWRSQEPWGGKPGFSTPPAHIGDGGGNDWYFPAQREFRSEMFDPQGNPQLLDPEKYEGLQDFADRYGVDLRNKDFRDYWARAQQENPGGDDWWTPPADLVKSYWWDRDRRQSNHDFDKGEDGAFSQRMFGFRRTDPRTGREVFTVGDDIGRHPGGLGGALKDTVLGGLSAPATAGISLAEGDPRYAQMGGRSTLALFNHLLGADLGWNANTSANPDGFAKGQAGEGTNIGQDLNTTRGLFSPNHDPITGDYKPGAFNAVGKYHTEQAENPDAGPLARIAHRGMATTMDKGDDILYNLAIMRGLGIKPGLGNFQATSALSQSIPNLLDPNAAPHRQGVGRFTGAAGDAGQGYMLPFMGNPVISMAGQGFQESPLGKPYRDSTDAIRYFTAANPDAHPWVRKGGQGLATTMDMFPEMALAGQLPLGKNNLLTQTTQFPLRQAAGWSAFGGGMSGLELDGSNDSRAWQDRLGYRLNLPDRESQLRFDTSQRQFDELINALAKGRELPQAFLENIDGDALMPEQRSAVMKLMAMPKDQRLQYMQEQGFKQSPISASSGNSPVSPYQPVAPDMTAGPDDMQKLVETVSQMPPEQQQMWSTHLDNITASYLEQFKKAGANFTDEQLQTMAREQAMKALMQQIHQSQQPRQPFQVQLREKQNFAQNPGLPPIPGAPPSQVPGPQAPPIPPLDPNAMFDAISKAKAPPAAPPQTPGAPPTAPPQPPAPLNMDAPAQPQAQPQTPVDADRQKMQTPPQATQPQPQQPNPPGPPPQQPQPQQPKPQPGTTPQPQQAADPDTSALSIWPGFSAITNFVRELPEQASQYFEQATEQLTQTLTGTPQAQEATQKALQTGQLPEGTAETGIAAWTNEGFSFEQASQNFQNMSFPAQLALGAGLGLGVLGLVQAISGEGGIESWLLGALGLGTAAFMGGQAGLFDQGSMDFTNGLTQAGSEMTNQLFGAGESGQQKSKLNPMLSAGLQGMLDPSVPDSVAMGTLQTLRPMMSPEHVQQLNMASGQGSWGNAAMSWLGDVTGQRQRLMQDRLGLKPPQQDRLLSLWSQMQSAGK